MKIDGTVIDHVATLARLTLADDEKKAFTTQLSDILTYVEKINELDTDGVNPTDHIMDLKNVFREDTNRESLTTKAIEDFAPKFDEGHFIVPRIIEGAE